MSVVVHLHPKSDATTDFGGIVQQSDLEIRRLLPIFALVIEPFSIVFLLLRLVASFLQFPLSTLLVLSLSSTLSTFFSLKIVD
jgi:hypothetical protein